MSSSFLVMKRAKLQAYKVLKRAAYATVKYLVKDYVNGMEHIRGMGPCWPLLKRGYYGTHNKMLLEHPQRYVDEFVGRHNVWHLDTEKQMELTAGRLVEKNMICKFLTPKVVTVVNT